MLCLLLNAGNDCYALDVRQVVEVLPAVALARLPAAPPHVVGLLNYHGVPAPVVDLCSLTLGRACQTRLSTRIVLLRDAPDSSAGSLLGLRAEAVTETLDLPAEALAAAGSRPRDSACLHRNALGHEQLIVAWQSERLLPETLRAWLRQPPAGGVP